MGCGDEVARVAKPGLLADLGQEGQRVGGKIDLLLLGVDGEDLAQFVCCVRVGIDNGGAVKEIGNTRAALASGVVHDFVVGNVGGRLCQCPPIYVSC